MANITTTYNPNTIIALNNEEAHKLMQDPTFLQQAVANPLLLKAAMVAQGLTRQHQSSKESSTHGGSSEPGTAKLPCMPSAWAPRFATH